MKESISIIKEKIERNKTLVQNFSYLSALQVFNMLVPLITLPYLLKVLGRETYGLVVFAQAIVLYFQFLIDFGFNLSSTRNISIHRKDKTKISEIISSTLIIKGALFICSFLILFIVLELVPEVEEYKVLFYLTMHLCLYEWIFPIWFFQGIEKMKYITLLNLISRVIFLSMVFVLVKTEGDYLLVPILNGLGSVIAGITALWIVFREKDIHFRWPGLPIIKEHVIESFPLFLGGIAGKVKILSNKAILGAFVGMESVAIYDIADKIKNVFLYFLQLTGQVLYPNVSMNRNQNLIRKGVRINFIGGILIYLLLGLAISIVISTFFKSYQEVILLFWILGLLIFIQPTSYLIATGALLVNNHRKQYTKNLYLSTFVYLSLIGTVYSMGQINIYSVSVCLILSAITGLVSNLISCKKQKIINWVI